MRERPSHFLRMLGYHQHKRNIVHPQRRVKQAICIDQKDDVFDGLLDKIWCDLFWVFEYSRESIAEGIHLPLNLDRTARPASWSGGILTTCEVKMVLMYFIMSFSSSSTRTPSHTALIMSEGSAPLLTYNDRLNDEFGYFDART